MCTSLDAQQPGRTPRHARQLALVTAAMLGVTIVATTPLAAQADEGSTLTADVSVDLEGRDDPAGDQELPARDWPSADDGIVGGWQVSWKDNARFAVSWNKLSNGATAR
jgi:hypothetical protein